MYTIQKIKEYMNELNFDLHHYTTDNKQLSFVNDKHIHADIDVINQQMKLIYVHQTAMLSTTTGWFMLGHPQLKKLFLDKIEKIASYN